MITGCCVLADRPSTESSSSLSRRGCFPNLGPPACSPEASENPAARAQRCGPRLNMAFPAHGRQAAFNCLHGGRRGKKSAFSPSGFECHPPQCGAAEHRNSHNVRADRTTVQRRGRRGGEPALPSHSDCLGLQLLLPSQDGEGTRSGATDPPPARVPAMSRQARR